MFKPRIQPDSNELSFGNLGSHGQGDATLSLAQAITMPLRAPHVSSPAGVIQRLIDTEWVPDLGQDIGSARWFRGLATMTALCAVSYAMLPGFKPLVTAPAMLVSQAQAEEFRTQAIMPLAYGGDTGRRMAASDTVLALAESPERPTLELSATLGQGDSFLRVLQRAGVGSKEAGEVAQLVAQALPLADIKPGTRLDVVLGRRASRNMARPLDAIAFRARFDLNLEVNRVGEALQLTRDVIVVDDTPLRIRGTVGSSLYRSARAAGAPAQAVQTYLRTLSTQLSVGRDIRSTDEFDMIIEYRRAETGEIEVGNLLYAGLERGAKPRAQMLRWNTGGRDQWFEASGVGETSGELARPVSGAVSSGFGMRRHPILGYRRMHSGLDFRAGHGEPIYAAAEGTVNFSGRKGGFGNFVRINHGDGLASGYAHMSRIAVSSGTRVQRGQVIGYVGSTGLSTGPHLHYELYRNGKAINPQSVRFTTRAQLGGQELRAFKAQLASLMTVTPGAALAALESTSRTEEPVREIARLSKAD